LDVVDNTVDACNVAKVVNHSGSYRWAGLRGADCKDVSHGIKCYAVGHYYSIFCSSCLHTVALQIPDGVNTFSGSTCCIKRALAFVYSFTTYTSTGSES
jgi:hypothetical protein